jgi:uncharacterized Tic20 family protein
MAEISIVGVVLTNIIESVFFLITLSLVSCFSIIVGCICLKTGKEHRGERKTSCR